MNCCNSIENSITNRCEKCLVYYCLNGEDVNKFTTLGYRLLFLCPNSNLFNILIDFGANPYYSYCKDNMSIIDVCVYFRFRQSLLYLTEQGFDINKKSYYGYLPTDIMDQSDVILNIYKNANIIRRDYIYNLYEKVNLIYLKFKNNGLYEWRVSRMIIKYLTHNIK